MSQAVASTTDVTRSPPRALSASQRFWEIDSWRGIAITTMVIYHLVYDLRTFVGMDIELVRGFWFYFQRFTAISFVTLVGISLVVSYNRARGREGGTRGLYWKFFRRGLKVLGIGLAIGLVTYYGGIGRNDFGVLHMIGTSIILAYPFLGRRWLSLAVAALLFALSYPIAAVRVDTLALVWLGFVPLNYYPIDYFPLVHWFAVVLIGIFIGNVLYTNGRRQFALPDLGAFFPFNALQLLGRHSLLIYVIHQPILYGGLILVGLIEPGF